MLLAKAVLAQPMSKILSLDQATRVSGWSFFNNGTLTAFGHWEKTHEDIAVRINSLCQEIEMKIKEYEPDLIVLENIQLQHGDVQTFQKLAQVQGGILALVAKYKIPYRIIYPSDWRADCQFLKGNDKHRENQKKIAQEWVKTTYNMKCTQDEADAICIGYSQTAHEDNRLEWD